MPVHLYDVKIIVENTISLTKIQRKYLLNKINQKKIPYKELERKQGFKRN